MKIVIVGSGLAGVTLGEALAGQPGFTVTLVTNERHGYYSRPRLSHGMALTDAAAARIVLKRFDGLAPGLRVLLNSLEDLLTLRSRRARVVARGRVPRWAIVGGGLIGCELASDLHKAGDSVTIFHREARLIELQLSPHQSQALHAHFAALGIEVRYGQNLDELPHPYDGVIVAAGFASRIELAKEADLPTARGIAVNEYLRTADPGIYAVGDVAEIGGRLYPFVSPIRSQALWLAEHLAGRASGAWTAPAFTPVMKIHGFKAPEACAVL
jgi:NAD(P)H-nitrite reductase large subunit